MNIIIIMSLITGVLIILMDLLIASIRIKQKSKIVVKNNDKNIFNTVVIIGGDEKIRKQFSALFNKKDIIYIFLDDLAEYIEYKNEFTESINILCQGNEDVINIDDEMIEKYNLKCIKVTNGKIEEKEVLKLTDKN